MIQTPQQRQAVLTAIATKITHAGWAIAAIEPAHLTIWHSNGDDQAHVRCLNEVWEGIWIDRDGTFMEPFTFDDDISAESTDVDRIAAAIIRGLTKMDPTCARCGFQGHATDECDFVEATKG